MNKIKLNFLLKKILIERNIIENDPLSAYLCAINTDSPRTFVKICLNNLEKEIIQEESRSNPLGNMLVYKKSNEIFDAINNNSIEFLKKEITNKDKSEMFLDDFPIFIVRNIGDLDLASKNVIDLEKNIDWIVHDLFHFIFDYSWLINVFKIKLNEELKYFLSNSGFKFGKEEFAEADKILRSECIIFLNNVDFTKGVGEVDYYASIAAYTLLNRDKMELSDTELKGIKNKELFKEFYSIVYDYSHQLFEEICKNLKNKIICLTVNQ